MARDTPPISLQRLRLDDETWLFLRLFRFIDARDYLHIAPHPIAWVRTV